MVQAGAGMAAQARQAAARGHLVVAGGGYGTVNAVASALAGTGRVAGSVSASFYALEAFAPVRAALKDYQPASERSLNHPYFNNASPCTMLIDDVETLWKRIAQSDDWSQFESKLAHIEQMAAAYHLT